MSDEYIRDLDVDDDPVGDRNVAVADEGQEPQATAAADEAIADDLDQPYFEYEDESGQKVTLTGRDILEMLEQRDTQAKQPEAKPEEPKPEEQQPPEEPPFKVQPVDLQKAGKDLVAMLEGEHGGPDAIGPALVEFNFQTFLQDPRYYQVLTMAVNKILEEREKTVKKTESFKGFVGQAEIKEDEVRQFMRANPWAETREMALLGLQLDRMKRELDQLRSGQAEVTKKAELEAERRLAENMKTKLRLLRPLAGRSGTARPMGGGSKYDLTDPDQRSMAMAEYIMKLREKGE